MQQGLKQIIVITGVPGAGKTETARKLISLCPEKSVWVDTDKLVGIQPFVIDEAFYDLLYSNLSACLLNYARWGASVIVISGVILPVGIYHRIKDFQLEGYRWYYYGLTASMAIIQQRIINDNKGQDSIQRKLWSHFNKQVYQMDNCLVINNSKKNIEEVTAIIAVRQKLIKRVRVPKPKAGLKIPVKTVREMLQKILIRHGVNVSTASKVIESLVNSEKEGYPSHGILRFPEYIDALRAGIIDNEATPLVKVVSKQSCVVDGNRSWGVLAAQEVSKTIGICLKENDIAAVSLVNSNHIGRLSIIANPLVEEGYIVLGFVNYLGNGQRVPVFGGMEGRFCTNPILIGIPAGELPPIVLDMTTSAVSEGRIREYAISKKNLPDTWLIDKNWKPVTNAEHLYSNPPQAMIRPFGGEQSYKGAGLVLCIEILAGIITNAGFVQKSVKIPGGNGGMFIGLRPELFGGTKIEIYKKISQLIDYCRQSNIADDYKPFRYPGEFSFAKKNKSEEWIELKSYIWETIQQLNS